MTKKGITSSDPRSSVLQTQSNIGSSKNKSDDDESEEEDDDLEIADGYKGRRNITWTSEEETLVREHYHLQSLFPDVWEESISSETQPFMESSNVTNETEAKIDFSLNTERTTLDLSDPLGIKESIFGRSQRKILTVTPEQIKAKSHLLISDKHFNAKDFLREVHKGTSFRDLEVGVSKLHGAIDDRTEIMKNLVKTHFAKFVNAKSTIDTFYSEMRENNLLIFENRGVNPVIAQLKESSENANALYGPLLERRKTAEKIRAALSILEQWKFFFNLPAVMLDSIKKGKLDATVRDYKKGKYLMQSSFPSSGTGQRPITVQTSMKEKNDDSSLLPERHRAVFEKLWNEVENIVEDLRTELFHRLAEHTVPLEQQEKILAYLSDIDPKIDPVWYYLENQYTWILAQFVDNYEDHTKRMEVINMMAEGNVRGETQENGANEIDGASSASLLDSSELIGTAVIKQSNGLSLAELKKTLATVHTDQYESTFFEDMDLQLWIATYRFVNNIINILTKTLPDFWKLCKMYSDGRFAKKADNPADLTSRHKRKIDAKKMEQCQEMIRNVLSAFDLLLSNCFYTDLTLSQIREAVGKVEVLESVQSPRPSFVNNSSPLQHHQRRKLSAMLLTPPDFARDLSNVSFTLSPITPLKQLPPLPAMLSSFLLSNPLMTCHYGIQISEKLSRCIEEVKYMHVGGGGSLGAEDYVFEKMVEVVERIKHRIIESICTGFISESKNFYTFEHWIFEQTAMNTEASEDNNQSQTNKVFTISSETTPLPELFYRFAKNIVQCLHQIAIVSTAQTPSPSNTRKLQSNESKSASSTKMKSLEYVRTAFFESQYAFLDGLQWLAVHWKEQETDNKTVQKLKTEQIKTLDVSNVDTRVLVVLTSLKYIRTVYFPKLIQRFEEKFNMNFQNETKSLYETADYLDQLLFNNYIKRKSAIIYKLIRQGLLFSGMNWNGLVRPQEVRSYAYEILLFLVLTHAEVSEVSNSLKQRVFSELLAQLGQHLLTTIREIEQFSKAGRLQAILECLFIYQTLYTYSSSVASEAFDSVYRYINRDVVENLPTEDSSPKPSAARMMTDEQLIESVKQYLKEAKNASSIQNACFNDRNKNEGLEDLLKAMKF